MHSIIIFVKSQFYVLVTFIVYDKKGTSNEGGSSLPDFNGETAMDLKNKPEKCVICGAVTGYFACGPVAKRKHYVTGCGQLCGKC